MDLIINNVVVLVAAFGGSAFGAYWAYRLSRRSAKEQEKRIKQHEKATQKERNQAIYLMLRLEISQNLEMLGKYWQGKVEPLLPVQYEDASQKDFQHLLNFIREPLPPVSHLVRDTHIAALSSILHEEKLIRAAFNHYALLNRLPLIRAALNNAIPELVIREFLEWVAKDPKNRGRTEVKWLGTEGNTVIHPLYIEGLSLDSPQRQPTLGQAISHFCDHSSKPANLWRECKSIFQDMLRLDNPLPEKMPEAV
jgi:hypothetical protein